LTRLDKRIHGALTDPLLHIYNKSMLEGIFPDKLKMDKVIPIYRKGDISLASNYGPISLISLFDRLLEKLVYKRVYTFLVKYNILYKYQFGFRHNYSTSIF